MLLAAPRLPVLLAAPCSLSENAGDFGSTGLHRLVVYSTAAFTRPTKSISALMVIFELATLVSVPSRLRVPSCSTTANLLPAGG